MMVMGAMSAMGWVSNPPFAGPWKEGPGAPGRGGCLCPTDRRCTVMTQRVLAQKASCAAASAYPPASERRAGRRRCPGSCRPTAAAPDRAGRCRRRTAPRGAVSGDAGSAPGSIDVTWALRPGPEPVRPRPAGPSSTRREAAEGHCQHYQKIESGRHIVPTVKTETCQWLSSGDIAGHLAKDNRQIYRFQSDAFIS